MGVVEIHKCSSSYHDVSVDSYVDLVHVVDDMVVLVFAFDEVENFVAYSVVKIVVQDVVMTNVVVDAEVKVVNVKVIVEIVYVVDFVVQKMIVDLDLVVDYLFVQQLKYYL